MKITKLTIEKLHGYYSYEVKFKDDVTFLYGANGCGKTTILNIVASIITGEINKLFQYKFDRIVLECKNTKKNNQITTIKIMQKEKGKLTVVYNNETIEIELIKEPNEVNNQKEVEKTYFFNYPILEEIRNIFNYVYLPLNRSSSVFASSIDEREYYMYKRRYISFDEKFNETQFERHDRSMDYVESLVMSKVLTINSSLSAINDNFRNDIFKSFLSEFRNVNFIDIIKELDKDRAININKIKKDFIDIVKNIDLWSPKHEEQINLFFDDINEMHNEYNNDKSSQGIKSDLIFGYTKIMQVKEILKIANKMEESKNKIQKPIEIFLKTVNEFIGFSEDSKQLAISREGKIYFTNYYSKDKIRISKLSSGEKQLITFFAYLIFGVKQYKSGIFIVDEPELSLHLAWQKIFVEKVLEINSNVQLIFATHSPEIIGKYRENTFRLIKKSNEGEYSHD